MHPKIESFVGDLSGNTALFTALVAFVLVGVAGLAATSVTINHEKAALQEALDGAVLAGASLGFSRSDDERVDVAAKFLSQKGYDFGRISAEAMTVEGNSVVFRVEDKKVVGEATIVVPNFFGAFSGRSDYPVTVIAKAAKRSSDSVCFHALNPKLSGSVQLYGNANLTADCVVVANSSDTTGLLTWGKFTKAEAKLFGVTGSYAGTFAPEPITDIEPLSDQYALLPVPKPGTCTDLGDKISKATVDLEPATYCGGLTISPGSTVTLKPGIHVFYDGPLSISAGSILRGRDVTLAFIGKNAILLSNAGSEIDLTSPRAGIYANIQFISDRKLNGSWKSEEWSTLSSTKIRFDGLMYMPEQDVWLKGNTQFEGRSPTMIVVADQFWIQDGSEVALSQTNERGLELKDSAEGFRYAARLTE